MGISVSVTRSLLAAGIFLVLIMTYSARSAAGTHNKDHSPLLVHFGENLLTVRGKEIPFERILREIAAKAGIEIVLKAPEGVVVSADFSDLPLESGLKRLARGFGLAIIYRSEEAGEGEIQEVRIYANTGKAWKKSTGKRAITFSPSAAQSLQSAAIESSEMLLAHQNPEERLKMVQLLSESEDERALTYLIDILLTDEKESLRASAAAALGIVGGERAIDALSKALGDSSDEVRWNAVEALAGIGSDAVVVPLREAMQDENEEVKDTAAAALKMISMSAGVSQ
jgi:HEAT repeat protein